MTMTGGEGRGPGATNGQCAIPDTVAATHASRDCTALNTHASRDLPRKSSVLQAQATGNIFFWEKKGNCCAALSALFTPHQLRQSSAATCERHVRSSHGTSTSLLLPPCVCLSHTTERFMRLIFERKDS